MSLSVKKKVFVVSLIFLTATHFFALSVPRYLFELFRFDVTGITSIENKVELEKGREARALSDEIFLRQTVSFDEGKLTFGIIADNFFPDASSILYSSFEKENLEQESPDWVDRILLSFGYEASANVPENESIENEEAEEEEGDAKENSDSVSNEKKEEVFEREFFYENGRLRKFSYGDEIFSIGEENEDGVKKQISCVGDELRRKTYAENQRLTAIEKWTLGKNTRETFLKSKKIFSYDEESENAKSSVETFYKKGAVQILAEAKNENLEKEIEMFYDEGGKTVRKNVFRFEKGEKEGDEAKKLPEEFESWKYDEEGRVVENSKTLYNHYKTTRGKEVVEKSESKTVFKYTEKSDNPDSWYYEDGELRIETVYSDVNTYSQKMCFDDRITILLKYVGGLKKSEVVYSGEKIIREKHY